MEFVLSLAMTVDRATESAGPLAEYGADVVRLSDLTSSKIDLSHDMRCDALPRRVRDEDRGEIECAATLIFLPPRLI
jgi:hypothetical protein